MEPVEPVEMLTREAGCLVQDGHTVQTAALEERAVPVVLAAMVAPEEQLLLIMLKFIAALLLYQAVERMELVVLVVLVVPVVQAV